MTAGSSILAITRSRPQQRRQTSMSIVNTRFSRCAHASARCRSLAEASARSLVWSAAAPRVFGTTRPRSWLAGANTPLELCVARRRHGHEPQTALSLAEIDAVEHEHMKDTAAAGRGARGRARRGPCQRDLVLRASAVGVYLGVCHESKSTCRTTCTRR